ncbi:hypothetical protein EV182_000177 [Spiromyces aspiralis]|uniref:Uncharacterized protein n=1 Tax=Spiromyces aspiralis TaxID=68401 RepID=A0ACC1HVM3_9FUNG|nr:hypothetical protein EV182_000177 [Spiromyces aspiralis]
MTLLIISSYSCVLWVFGTIPVSAGQNSYDRFLNFFILKLFSVRAILNTEWGDLIVWASCYWVFGLLHMFAGLCRDYFNYNNRYQMRAHIQWRILVTLIGLISTTAAFSAWCYVYLQPLFRLLVVEALTIHLDLLQTLVKYLTFFWEYYVGTSQGSSDDVVCMFEYLTDIAIIMLALAHYLHIFVISGFSLNVINMLFLLNARNLFSKLSTKVCGLSAFRQVTQFPDATKIEIIEFNDNCAICCDELITAKKLPCSHLFHRTCLRAWLERDPSCPTCRRRLPSSETREWLSQLNDTSNEHGADLVLATPGIHNGPTFTLTVDYFDMPLSFTVNKVSAGAAGNCRQGIVRLIARDPGPSSPGADAATVELQTPNFLLYTVQGLQPHLTPQVAEELRQVPPISRVNLEEFLDKDIPSSSKYPLGLKRFLGVSSHASILLLDIFDPLNNRRSIKPSNTTLGIDTEGGLRRLSPRDLAGIVEERYRSDLFVLPADYVFEDAGNLLAGGKRAQKSVDRSIRWTNEYVDQAQKLQRSAVWFAPLMGSNNLQQRKRSAEFVAKLPEVSGYVVNETGLRGIGFDEKLELAKYSLQFIDERKPRYMVGVSSPDEVLEAVSGGIDLFDAVYPFAVTEQGFASTYVFGNAQEQAAVDPKEASRGHIDLWGQEMFDQIKPLVNGCSCFTCRNHTRSYIHHLLMTHEMLATVLLQIHNMHWYSLFFESLRASLDAGSFDRFKRDFLSRYRPNGDDSDGQQKPHHLLYELTLLHSQTVTPTTKAGYNKFGRRPPESEDKHSTNGSAIPTTCSH